MRYSIHQDGSFSSRTTCVRELLVLPARIAWNFQLHMDLICICHVHTDTILGMRFTAVVSAFSALISLEPLEDTRKTFCILLIG